MEKYDSSKDYYGVLGVRLNASPEEIDRAFRAKARKQHPDGGGTEEAMKSLNEAHDVLSDGETRRAYDEARRPSLAYVSSTGFDPDAASRAGTLHVPVSDPDFAGLVMSAIGCFALGVPLLLLVEMQWMFFLWPLRLLSLGALAAGAYMAHSALAVKQRKLKKDKPANWRGLVALREIVFWIFAAVVLGALVVGLYVRL